MFKSDTFARRVPQAVWHYGLAVLSVAMALAITQSLEPYTTLRTPLFYAAILITAWVGGIGPGVLAVVLATLALGYYFSPPGHLLGPDAIDLPFILFFSLSAILITWVSARRRAVEEALKRAHDDLETKVEERTADLQRANEVLQIEITERRRSEEALRKSEERWQAVFANSAVGITLADLDGRFTAANTAYQKMLGYSDEELRALSFFDITDEDFRDDSRRFIRKLLEGEQPFFEVEKRYRRKNGNLIWAHAHVSLIPGTESIPRFLMAIVEDITERKHAEEELQRAQAELAHVTRLTTLGELTASIAHEVNQPLAAVSLNANACLRWLAGEAPNLIESRQAIERIVKEASRASEVIARIRALARKTPPRKDRSDINEVLLEVIALAHSELRRHRVNLHTQLADDLPLVLADRVQLQQVILNLIINGIEAMSGISERPRELVISSAKHEGTGVLVAVRDSGVGLDSKNLDQLFDAFHTTKPDGMGMGLAISRSIIEAHGGWLWAAANAPVGAVFQFTLPVDGEEGL